VIVGSNPTGDMAILFVSLVQSGQRSCDPSISRRKIPNKRLNDLERTGTVKRD
jgi:hypothetical protein